MIKRMIFGSGEITNRLQFEGWFAHWEWKPQDLWVGVYWKSIGHAVDVWICFLPCIPLHITLLYHDPEQ
mgnify:CR=1 FL=1